MSIAWCAGLFDGEGCFSIYSRNISYDMQASMQMTRGETVKAFHRFIDCGNISFRPTTNPKWKNLYRWQAFGSDVAKVAKLLLPYLITKKDQAELIIEFDLTWKRGSTGKHYISITEKDRIRLNVIVSEIKDLNRKGPTHSPGKKE